MKKWVISSFFLVGLAIALYFVLKKISIHEIYLLIVNANSTYLLLAVLSTFLAFVVWATRWFYIFRKKFFFLLRVLFAGAFFNMITPAMGIAGDIFKAHLLSKKFKKSRVSTLGYVFGDKFSQLLVLVLFSVFSILFLLFYVKLSNTLKYVLEGILVLVLTLLIIAIYLILKKFKFNVGTILQKLHFIGFISRRFKTSEDFKDYTNKRASSFIRILKKFIKRKDHLIIGIFLSILFWMCNYLTTYFLFLAFIDNVNFLSVIIVVTLGTIIGDLSFSPAGAGFNEATMVLLFSAMQIPVSLALVVVLFSRIIYYFFSLVVGGLSLITLNSNNYKKEKG
jgi:uncharacterized protein (TIRG00374 family)